MAQFPPNLDDGELYLPSDIFLNQKIPSRFYPNHHNHRNLSYMDDLAHHFTALSLLRKTLPNPPLKIPHNSEVGGLNSPLMRPPVRTHVVNPLRPPSYHARHGGLELEVGHRPFSAPKPTPTSSDRVVQMQQLNRLVQQNRVLPNQGNGFGFRGGLPRESGGTGVFHPHPRITNTIDAKKKQSLRGREDMQRKSEQRNSVMRVGVSKREDCYYHLPPEMGLPRDWTY
ncbi:hypothetical protein Dsin_006855 [Dipteronia sinensis]|uniref:Uncharacterized protein n=1 Tax=Dipteronia sinensis TaxID=43782 RepID=A0AAE0AZ29_9ROSI|nr:hypothetical protein Dsin_006855 [Dipteronia sinensis]